jgi:hypothetical protein
MRSGRPPVERTWHGADWDLYYYNGLETGPAFAFTTTLTAPVPRNSSRVWPARYRTLPAGFRHRTAPDQRADPDGGTDVAFETHGFTIRAEGAFSADRLVPRSASESLSADNLANATRDDLVMIATELAAGNTVPVDLGNLFVRRNLVQWGAAVDYHYLGWTPQLQVNQTVVLDNSTKLLINDVDTRLFFLLKKAFFADRLETELGVVQGLERSYTSAGARLTYALTDHLRLRLGGLLIGGSRDTEIGQFKANDEFYFQPLLVRAAAGAVDGRTNPAPATTGIASPLAEASPHCCFAMNAPASSLRMSATANDELQQPMVSARTSWPPPDRCHGQHAVGQTRPPALSTTWPCPAPDLSRAGRRASGSGRCT